MGWWVLGESGGSERLTLGIGVFGYAPGCDETEVSITIEDIEVC